MGAEIAAARSAGNSATAAGPSASLDAAGTRAFDAMSTGQPTQFQGELSESDFSDTPEIIATPIQTPDDKPTFQHDVAADFAKKAGAKPQPKQEQVTQEAQPEVTQQTGRNYADFLPEDAAILKKMPNHVFDAVKTRFAEIKNLRDSQAQTAARIAELEKGGMPAQYSAHPEAYRLTPAFTQASDTIQQADFEIGIIENAINAIETGKPYQILDGYDQAGNPILRDVEPLKNAQGELLVNVPEKNRLLRVLQKTDFARTEAQRVAQGLRAQHGAAHKAAIAEFKRAQAEIFPAYEKPEYAQQIDSVARSLPQFLQNDPNVAQFAARGSMLINALHAEVTRLKGELSKHTMIQSDRRSAGPSPTLLSGAQGGARESQDMLSMAEFED